MAIFNARDRIKNDAGEYDIFHYETNEDMVVMRSGKTLHEEMQEKRVDKTYVDGQDKLIKDEFTGVLSQLGFYGGVNITSVTDANLLTNGMELGLDLTNGPTNGWFYYITVVSVNPDYTIQFAIDYGVGTRHVRIKAGNTWGVWDIDNYYKGIPPVGDRDIMSSRKAGMYHLYNATGELPPGVLANDNDLNIQVIPSGAINNDWYRVLAHDVRSDRSWIRTVRGGIRYPWVEISTSQTENLQLLNGWENYSDFGIAKATRSGGIVKLSGTIRNGTTTAYTPLAQLPAGLRPSTSVIAYAFTGNAPTVAVARIGISTSGAITLNQDFTSGSAYLPLDSISFII